eukprot:scaffold3556_cov215-Prasinococcus_capsulatus_cf.AAC.1
MLLTESAHSQPVLPGRELANVEYFWLGNDHQFIPEYLSSPRFKKLLKLVGVAKGWASSPGRYLWSHLSPARATESGQPERASRAFRRRPAHSATVSEARARLPSHVPGPHSPMLSHPRKPNLVTENRPMPPQREVCPASPGTDPCPLMPSPIARGEGTRSAHADVDAYRHRHEAPCPLARRVSEL